MMRDWLLSRRKILGWSQARVACESAITHQAYSQIERNKVLPLPATAKLIAHALDFHWTKFYEDA